MSPTVLLRSAGFDHFQASVVFSRFDGHIGATSIYCFVVSSRFDGRIGADLEIHCIAQKSQNLKLRTRIRPLLESDYGVAVMLLFNVRANAFVAGVKEIWHCHFPGVLAVRTNPGSAFLFL